MRVLLISVVFLLVVCGPRIILAGGEFEDDNLMDMIQTSLNGMAESQGRRMREAMDNLQTFITENVVERLDSIEEMVESVQAKQTYFERCLNMGPCEHGTCSVDGESYLCTCFGGYIGRNCEIVDSCYDVECLNGGTCVNNNGTGYMCLCNGSWHGEHCELEAPCAAELAKINPDVPMLLGAEKPRCDIDGFYLPVQYLGSQAYCVTDLGEKIPYYFMNRWDVNENSTCSCAREEFSTHMTNMEFDRNRCVQNGNYAPFVCEQGMCYCQDLTGYIDRENSVAWQFQNKLKC